MALDWLRLVVLLECSAACAIGPGCVDNSPAGPAPPRLARANDTASSATGIGFTAAFDTNLIRLRPATGAAWEGHVSLAGYGCAGAVAPVEVAAATRSAQRIEYRRQALTEWYTHVPAGLEQGFTLWQDQGCPLVAIAVRFGGDFIASQSSERQFELSVSGHGPVLQYSDLRVSDAAGRPLPARFIGRPYGVDIEVEVAGAAYPVTVDPLIWMQRAWLAPAQIPSWVQMGVAVAVDGDTLIIGGYGDPYRGAAYVFVREGGFWTETAELIPGDLQWGGSHGFGEGLAVSGDLAVVAATGGGSTQGSAYVYLREAGTWTTIQRLKPPSTDADWFGISMATDGDTILVGSPGKWNAGVKGVAYVFVRDGASWTQQAMLTPPLQYWRETSFGYAVALSGETALIGAPGEGNYRGGAYVFVRSNGVWTQTARLAPTSTATQNGFGAAVALANDTALVGAVYEDDTQGAAHVFELTDGTWLETAKLVAPTRTEWDCFGWAMALPSRETALVGLPGNPYHLGLIAAFRRAAGSWLLDAVLEEPVTGDNIGHALAASGTTVTTGARGQWGGGGAYVYQLLKTAGEPCVSPAECLSTFCVDGVCCAAACTDQCMNCSASGTSGTCAFVTGAPLGGRPPCVSDASVCGGTCPGTGASCAYPDSSTRCRAASCTLGVAATDAFCNGAGSCPAAMTSPCAPYVCGPTACETTCAGEADCVDGYYCDSSGHCTATLANGQPCTDGVQCHSGFCIDGVCCASVCGGTCERCDATGTCVAAAAGTDPDDECPGSGPCKAVCDGAYACAYPGAMYICGLCAGCDSAGGCSAAVGDDPACGFLSCASLDTACRSYTDITTNRCAAVGSCLQPDATTCTAFTDAPEGTGCSCADGASGACLAGECACPAQDGGTAAVGWPIATLCGCHAGASGDSPLLLVILLAVALRTRRRRS